MRVTIFKTVTCNSSIKQNCVCVSVCVTDVMKNVENNANKLIYLTNVHIYRVSQEECARLREGVPYVKVYRYNPKRLCPKLNVYGDNGQRSLKF